MMISDKASLLISNLVAQSELVGALFELENINPVRRSQALKHQQEAEGDLKVYIENLEARGE